MACTTRSMRMERVVQAVTAAAVQPESIDDNNNKEAGHAA